MYATVTIYSGRMLQTDSKQRQQFYHRESHQLQRVMIRK